MINQDVYDRILNSLDDSEKTCIKEMNRNSFVKENELDQANPLENQKSYTGIQSKSNTKNDKEIENKNNVSPLRNDRNITTEILDKLESIENQLGDSLRNQEYSKAAKNDVQDRCIESEQASILDNSVAQIKKKRKLVDIESDDRVKRKTCHEEVNSPMRENLNSLDFRGTKRKTDNPAGSLTKKLKVSETKTNQREVHENDRKRKNYTNDENISKKQKFNKGTKRKISGEHDEIESKKRKLNNSDRKGIKRKKHIHIGNSQKKRKLCFDIWE